MPTATSGHRKPRGFGRSPEITQVAKLHSQTSWPISALISLGDILIPYVLAAVGFALYERIAFTPWLVLVLLSWLVTARCQRGHENLTHEGSHQNFHRSSSSRTLTSRPLRLLARLLGVRWPKPDGDGRAVPITRAKFWNDLLTNLLAAIPTFNDVANYWPGHHRHHTRFGAHDDPCRPRFDVPRSSLHIMVRATLRALIPYLTGWLYAFGLSPLSVVRGLVWHVCVWIVPWGLAFGWQTAWTVWAVFWLAPFVLVLPWVRFIAESGKHDYKRDTEFDATISNIGWKHHAFFNPHGDGHHLLHHWMPSVPHHRLAKLHRELLRLDEPNYRSRHPHRIRVVQDPTIGIRR